MIESNTAAPVQTQLSSVMDDSNTTTLFPRRDITERYQIVYNFEQIPTFRQPDYSWKMAYTK
jgi:hypothetical protein